MRTRLPSLQRMPTDSDVAVCIRHCDCDCVGQDGARLRVLRSMLHMPVHGPLAAMVDGALLAALQLLRYYGTRDLVLKA